MEGLAESMPGQAAMPRFEDGSINLRGLIRRLAEDVVNAIMDACRQQFNNVHRNTSILCMSAPQRTMSVKEVLLEMMTLLDKARIIGMHLRGMANIEIAENLGIHRNTVGKYVREYESHAEVLRRCEAGSRSLKKRVGRIMSPVFRAKDAATARAIYHVFSSIAL